MDVERKLVCAPVIQALVQMGALQGPGQTKRGCANEACLLEVFDLETEAGACRALLAPVET